MRGDASIMPHQRHQPVSDAIVQLMRQHGLTQRRGALGAVLVCLGLAPRDWQALAAPGIPSVLIMLAWALLLHHTACAEVLSVCSEVLGGEAAGWLGCPSMAVRRDCFADAWPVVAARQHEFEWPALFEAGSAGSATPAASVALQVQQRFHRRHAGDEVCAVCQLCMPCPACDSLGAPVKSLGMAAVAAAAVDCERGLAGRGCRAVVLARQAHRGRPAGRRWRRAQTLHGGAARPAAALMAAAGVAVPARRMRRASLTAARSVTPSRPTCGRCWCSWLAAPLCAGCANPARRMSLQR